MLDLADRDKLLPLRQAAALIPSRRNPAKPIALSTLFRWIVCGIKVGRNRVRLNAIRLAGGWYVTMPALQAFAAECSQVPARPAFPSAGNRKRQEAAERYLNQRLKVEQSA